MNYETLYEALKPQEKSLKDNIASLQKLFKAAGRETESGDLKSLSRDIKSMSEAAKAISSILSDIETSVDGFDAKTYFENGDFAEQMLDVCREKGVDVRGDFPVYEMFPYRVRLDAENQDVYLDRKKVQCMRPQSLIDIVKTGQEKLNKASFNPQLFLGELSEAYNIALLKKNKNPGSDILLANLYKFLAPMSRFRKDYDQHSFAYDLARLYNSDIRETKNGRCCQFGPSRNSSEKSYRILDKYGNEQFLATICFYEE